MTLQSKNNLIIFFNSLFTITLIISILKLSNSISNISTGTDSKSLIQQLTETSINSYPYCLLLIISLLFLYSNKFYYSKFDLFLYNKSFTPAILNAGFIIVGIYTSVTSAAILKWISPGDEIKLSNSDYKFELFLALSLILIHCQIKHFKSLKFETDKAKQENEKRELTHNENIKKSETELKNRIEQLADVIRLAPPNNFAAELSNYADILEDWSTNHLLTLTLLLDDSSSRSEYEEAIKNQRIYIRASLMAITKLAGIYDNAELNESSNDFYRSNLALSLKKKNITEVLLHDASRPNGKRTSNEKYRININSEPNFRLFIDSRYSVCVNNSDTSILRSEDDDRPKEFPEDKDIKNISFPVYLTSDIEIYNVIGAPRALATCQAQFITNTITEIDLCEKSGAPQPLLNEAKEYFQKDKKGRSIISMPLASNRYRKEHLKANNMQGTVNIYRNTTGIFNNDKEKFNNFVHLVNPLLVSLSRMTDFHILTLDNYERLHYNQLKQRS